MNVKAQAVAAAGDQQASLAYAWYVVVLCMIAYIFSFIDRQVIVLLIEPIRADLQISDTQFSLLHGLAFAFFYALMGIPIARLADTRSRPLIIATGVFVWSLATAACGLTRTFWQLFAARMAVGAGEAALSPAAYSMISDLFPKSKLGLALGVYSIGSFIGAGLAFLIGGTVIEWMERVGVMALPLVGTLKPWQMTFVLVGLPGVLISALFVITVRNPERKNVIGASAAEAGPTRAYTLGELFAYMGVHRYTFIAHYLGFGFLALSLYALLSWAPAFFMRNFDMSAREVGLYLGTAVLLGNTAGVLSSGWLADWFTRRGYDDGAMRAGMVGALGVVIPGALFSSMPGFPATLAVLAIGMYFASFPMATSAAALQLMAPNQMRAQVTALFFLSMNLFGIAGGSTSVALLTDFVFVDEKAVGYSMAITCAVAGIAGALLLGRGMRHYRVTVQAVQSGQY